MDCEKTATASKTANNNNKEESSEARTQSEVVDFNNAGISESHLSDAPQVGLRITKQDRVKKNSKRARRMCK